MQELLSFHWADQDEAARLAAEGSRNVPSYGGFDSDEDEESIAGTNAKESNVDVDAFVAQ
jgi:23S rRNA G2445 N2-methylase RlmL